MTSVRLAKTTGTACTRCRIASSDPEPRPWARAPRCVAPGGSRPNKIFGRVERGPPSRTMLFPAMKTHHPRGAPGAPLTGRIDPVHPGVRYRPWATILTARSGTCSPRIRSRLIVECIGAAHARVRLEPGGPGGTGPALPSCPPGREHHRAGVARIVPLASFRRPVTERELPWNWPVKGDRGSAPHRATSMGSWRRQGDECRSTSTATARSVGVGGPARTAGGPLRAVSARDPRPTRSPPAELPDTRTHPPPAARLTLTARTTTQW
jgi:hypothetical protein